MKENNGIEKITPKDHEACCRTASISLECPVCRKQGRAVGAVTLDYHLPPSARSRLGDFAGFCPNSACDIVYFDGERVISKGETSFPVTQKDAGDGVPVCYCFHFKRADIRQDLIERGTTDISEKIKQGIAEGRCACEEMNPQGACCLGNVVAAVKKIELEVKKHA
jgi:hypothetical protein